MPERVLVVDDDALVRRMLTRSLAAEGFEVEHVADGGAGATTATAWPTGTSCSS
jgi:DNA-binding response OmpR family regulator